MGTKQICPLNGGDIDTAGYSFCRFDPRWKSFPDGGFIPNDTKGNDTYPSTQIGWRGWRLNLIRSVRRYGSTANAAPAITPMPRVLENRAVNRVSNICVSSMIMWDYLVVSLLVNAVARPPDTAIGGRLKGVVHRCHGAGKPSERDGSKLKGKNLLGLGH
jgi:hypothetical protein